VVLIFKSNIERHQEHIVRAVLSGFSQITKVNFDFEDCDHILRIESKTDISRQVRAMLAIHNIQCSNLE
jgi:hypothetical protein